MARPAGGYTLKNGDPVPGTTTICGISKDSGGLIQWAYKTGKEHGRLMALGQEAPKHLYDVVDKAADIGTLAHECCEMDIRGLPLPEIPADKREQVMTAYGQFQSWKNQTRLKIVGTEVPLVSEKHQFGGTLDFVCEIDGVLCLGDFKTSGAVYPEMLMQLAAYRELWNENHNTDEKITGPSHLLRLGKESPDFSHHQFGDLSEAWEAFLLNRRLYDLLKKLKKRT
jgi:hypothetical protein